MDEETSLETEPKLGSESMFLTICCFKSPAEKIMGHPRSITQLKYHTIVISDQEP
jgi:hypothetical protein